MDLHNCQFIKYNVETLSGAKPLNRELQRKLFHLPVFVFPLIALYSIPAAIVVLSILIVTYVLICLHEKNSNRTISVFSRIISRCKRNVGFDRSPIYLAFGMIGALLIAPANLVFFAAYVIAICDSSASLVGIRFGKRKIPFLNKSFLGSMTFFVTCFFGGIYFLSPLGSLICAFVLTLTELVSIKGLDNFTLPITSQVLIVVLTAVGMC